MNNIDITPAGFGYDFLAYKTETLTIDELFQIVDKPELTAKLEENKPGFFKVEKYSGVLVASVAYPVKEETEVLKHGIVAKLELPVLKTARFVFLPGFMLVSGKSQAVKFALQVLMPYLNISSGYLKPCQEKLAEIAESAVVLKTVQFTNIPHSEIEKMSFSGELEDIYNQGNIPLREAEINSFNGVFNTPFGIKAVKYSRSGKVVIQKSKKAAVTLGLINWALEKIA